MSYHRVSQFAAKENILGILKDIGSNIEFGPEYSQLLEEYRNIGYGENAALDKAAAIEAYNTVKSSTPGLELNELGVSLPAQNEQVYYHRSGETTQIEREYIEQTVSANKEFLDNWKRKRARNRENTQLLDAQTGMISQSVQATLNSCPEACTIPSMLMDVVQSAGYVIPADELTVNPADYAVRGASFTGQNSEGDKVDIRIAGDQIYIHTDDRTGNPVRCQKQNAALSKLVADGLKKSKGMFGKMVVSTGSAGVGEIQPEKKAETEEIPGTLPDTNDDNLNL